jgi:hypothetical protein
MHTSGPFKHFPPFHKKIAVTVYFGSDKWQFLKSKERAATVGTTA